MTGGAGRCTVGGANSGSDFRAGSGQNYVQATGELHLMIHGCNCGFPNSAYLSVDWMLLRRQAYPNPSYGKWK